jgi:hypothetical protein
MDPSLCRKSELKIPNPKSQIGNPKSELRDFWLSGFEVRIWARSLAFRISILEYRVQARWLEPRGVSDVPRHLTPLVFSIHTDLRRSCFFLAGMLIV